MRKNIYDQMIIVLIVCSVFGYLGGFLYQPIILMTLFFFPKLIQNVGFFRFSTYKKTLLIFILLFAYAAVSIFWAPVFKSSLILLIRAAVHIIMCLEIIVFSQRAAHPLDSIAKGWIYAFLLTSVVAAWEMVTDHHLMVIAHQDMVFDVERHRAAVTFYNNNTYSLFVIFSLPFLLYRTMRARGDFHRLLLFLTLLILISIILLNASRAALLCLVIMGGVYMYFVFKQGDKGKKRSVMLVAGIIALFLLLVGSFLLEALLSRIADKDLFQDNIRIILWGVSWELFMQSHGFGQGFGGMVGAMSSYPGNPSDIDYSHNLILQLLLEGGVLFGGVFLIFLFKLFKSARKQKDPSRKMFLWAVLLSFPLYSILNSEYVSPTFIWLFFVSVYVFSSYPALGTRQIQIIRPGVRHASSLQTI